MSKQQKTYFLTGGAGFIGSHTADLLIKEGHQVAVLDNLSSGSLDNIKHLMDHPNFLMIEANIVNQLWPSAKKIISHFGKIDKIIHLAAQVNVITSIMDPLEDIRMNYQVTADLLELAKTYKVEKVVFASSAAVYGDEVNVPCKETDIVAPVSPYGIDKFGSEKFLYYYDKIHNISCTPLRFFNVYGPRQDPSSPYSGVISIFMDRSINNQDLDIFGDGNQTRDFVFVGDVAKAIYKASNYFQGHGEVFNVGTSQETTVNQLAQHVINAAGSKSEIHHKEARAGEIYQSFALTTKAIEHLNFKYSVPVQEGLKITVEWYKKASQ